MSALRIEITKRFNGWEVREGDISGSTSSSGLQDREGREESHYARVR